MNTHLYVNQKVRSETRIFALVFIDRAHSLLVKTGNYHGEHNEIDEKKRSGGDYKDIQIGQTITDPTEYCRPVGQVEVWKLGAR